MSCHDLVSSQLCSDVCHLNQIKFVTLMEMGGPQTGLGEPEIGLGAPQISRVGFESGWVIWASYLANTLAWDCLKWGWKDL